MPRKSITPEQVIARLRHIEMALANGKTLPQACKKVAIPTQSYYRWRREYGGLQVTQAKRFKDLERGNARLKKLVAELSLEKAMLKELASPNW
jgi:transposase-like protein